jgi:hypothetical protein
MGGGVPGGEAGIGGGVSGVDNDRSGGHVVIEPAAGYVERAGK